MSHPHLLKSSCYGCEGVISILQPHSDSNYLIPLSIIYWLYAQEYHRGTMTGNLFLEKRYQNEEYFVKFYFSLSVLIEWYGHRLMETNEIREHMDMDTIMEAHKRILVYYVN